MDIFFAVKTEPSGPWATPTASKAPALAATATETKPVGQTAPSLSGEKPGNSPSGPAPVVNQVQTAPGPAPVVQQAAKPVVGQQGNAQASNQPPQKQQVPPEVSFEYYSQNGASILTSSVCCFFQANTALNRALKMSMFFTAPGAESDNRPT